MWYESRGPLVAPHMASWDCCIRETQSYHSVSDTREAPEKESRSMLLLPGGRRPGRLGRSEWELEQDAKMIRGVQVLLPRQRSVGFAQLPPRPRKGCAPSCAVIDGLVRKQTRLRAGALQRVPVNEHAIQSHGARPSEAR